MGLIKIDFSQIRNASGEDSPQGGANLDSIKKNLQFFLKEMDEDRSHFFNLPSQSRWKQEIDEIQPQLAQRMPPIATFLHLGIGGSSLGAETIVKALGKKTAPAFHFVDNIDPDALHRILEISQPESTLVYVVTKSGGTFETLAAFMIVYEWLEKHLGPDHARQRLVFCTDPEKGDLRTLSREWKIPTFDIPPQLGGRFSVLSAVGLFPALASGVEPAQLLKGAEEYKNSILQDISEGRIPPVADLAQRLLNHYVHSQRMITVLMPYSQNLKIFSAWFTQLWAESLGKSGKGLTPVAAVGATDQHSILQLLKEGPEDKVVGFIEVQGFHEVPVLKWKGPGLGSFQELNGTTLNQLVDAELNATRQVLTNAKKPHFSIVLPRLNAHSLGQLFFFFETLTAIAGYAMGIDPFDQPGVEEGKKLTRERISACKKSSMS